MAVAHVNVDLSTIDVGGLFTYSQPPILTSTSMRFSDDAFNYVEFDGTGFTYLGGIPVSGTITGATYVEVKNTLVDITGANADVLTSFGFVSPTPDATGLFAYVLRDADTIYGSAKANDTLFGYGSDDKIFGYGGDDSLYGGSGNDTLLGSGGADQLFGGGGSDVLKGEGGNDTLNGGTGNDKLLGLTGNDLLVGSGGDDKLYGADGNDTLKGNAGNDREHGGDSFDKLIGGGGNDKLFGGAGHDTFAGGAGNDTLVGQSNADFLRGDGGDDTFDFNKVSDSAPGTGLDKIADFTQGHDIIDLKGIDADQTTSGNQAFDFIGTDPFGSHAGELRYVNNGSHTVVMGDVNGDGTADFKIELLTTVHLVGGDFIL